MFLCNYFLCSSEVCRKTPMYHNNHYKIVRAVKIRAVCGFSSSIQNTVDGLSTTICDCFGNAVFQHSKCVSSCATSRSRVARRMQQSTLLAWSCLQHSLWERKYLYVGILNDCRGRQWWTLPWVPLKNRTYSKNSETASCDLACCRCSALPGSIPQELTAVQEYSQAALCVPPKHEL